MQVYQEEENSDRFSFRTPTNVLFRDVYVALHKNYRWIVYEFAKGLGMSVDNSMTKAHLLDILMLHAYTPSFIVFEPSMY
jgi:hypothetical protein